MMYICYYKEFKTLKYYRPMTQFELKKNMLDKGNVGERFMLDFHIDKSK